MRLWTVHPKYLDARGLVALWREALLAQAVLRGQTIGYRHHPQLARFREQASPRASIADYLRGVYAEAVGRGYKFSSNKIGSARGAGTIAVRRGQVDHEWNHLVAKLAIRDPGRLDSHAHVRRPQLHPLFRVVRGGVEDWEKGADHAVATVVESGAVHSRRTSAPRRRRRSDGRVLS